MYTAGIDLGSATGKSVIMEDMEIVGTFIAPSEAHPTEMAKRVITGALKEAGLFSVDQLDNIITTGYGRLNIPFATENMSEISCHAKGAHWMIPSVRTVIDIGGQDSKVVSVNPDGSVNNFTMNDRCAAGTGRFFEGVCKGLGLGLEEISALENQGSDPCKISNQCSVFAESEVITLVNEEEEYNNIIAGVNLSVARRMRGMAHNVGIFADVVMTGGCSKNDGLVKAIGELIGVDLPVPPHASDAIPAAISAVVLQEGQGFLGLGGVFRQ